MKAESVKKKATIVGIGETKLGKVADKSTMDLYIDAATEAIEDAGINKDDIDGVLTSGSLVSEHPRHSIYFSENMGIYWKKYTDTMGVGGSSAGVMVQLAALLISSGTCNYVLLALADNVLSGMSRDGFVRLTNESFRSAQFESPFGTYVTTQYALAAQRHMFEYGTTSEQLAMIAVAMRKHASLNPKAQMREPITVDDVLQSRMICSPFHLLDCSLVSDGGAAFVMTSAERAKDLRKPPIYLLGAGGCYTSYYLSDMPTLTASGAKISGETAFKMAGVSRKDINVAGIYDSYTFTVLVLLEDLGFCNKGEGGSFVEKGRIELGGELPVNTHGGLLSCAHPMLPGGALHLTEIVRQLRGESGNRQVQDAEVGLVHVCAGSLSTHCTLILGRN